MNKKTLIRTIAILFVLALNIGCDQVSKSFIRSKIGTDSRYEYLHDHITIQKVENTGAFLSLGDSLSGPMKIILLNALPSLAILFGLYFILTRTDLDKITLFGV